jgi:hypothetical protein
MKYAVETGSGAIIYIPNYIETRLAIQKLMGEYAYTYTQRQHGYRISLLLFFQNKKSRLN